MSSSHSGEIWTDCFVVVVLLVVVVVLLLRLIAGCFSR